MQLLFSLTKKDFTIQTFTAGGKGGQHQNRSETGVRIIHAASGARGEARDSRSQKQNKSAAFQRLVNSKEFKVWHKLEVARRLGQLAEVERSVDAAMEPQNLKVEYF